MFRAAAHNPQILHLLRARRPFKHKSRISVNHFQRFCALYFSSGIPKKFCTFQALSSCIHRSDNQPAACSVFPCVNICKGRNLFRCRLLLHKHPAHAQHQKKNQQHALPSFSHHKFPLFVPNLFILRKHYTFSAVLCQ